MASTESLFLSFAEIMEAHKEILIRVIKARDDGETLSEA